MTKQIYFSFVLAILSFITVKRIQEAGIQHYEFLQTIFEKENGWFNFKKPAFVFNLPFELREISGVTEISSEQVACVQDENGIIFIYNLDKDSISNQYHFGTDGDYEGITRVENTFYILRSDAVLMEINAPWDSSCVTETKLNLASWNHEGICYDERDNRLLIAPKSKLGKGPQFKDTRAIFTIDLNTKILDENPLFLISISEIESFANANNLPLPQKISKTSTDSVSALKFLPSALAVHPKTNEIYILSAIDHTLAVYDKTGALINYILLDSKIFNKPEGITFLSNGDMIVTNEGQMGVPTLLKFTWENLNEEK